MSEQDALYSKEAQKTVAAFVVGLLVGGLLVWLFNEPSPQSAEDADRDTDSQDEDERDPEGVAVDVNDISITENEAEPESLPRGEGSVDVNDQSAGSTVSLEGAVFPSDEGWIGVRDYANNEVGGILGVVRFSKAQGLVPDQISLVRPTIAGKEYAVVYFDENGDRSFNPTTDSRVEGVLEVFTAK